MKRFETISIPVKIDKLVPGGQGIGTLPDGIKGFFWNALPEETVTKFQVTKKKSKYFEAVALEITNPSPHRIAPLDNCYLSTSPWQIMDYDYELAQKSALLTEQFRQSHLVTIITNEALGRDTELPCEARYARARLHGASSLCVELRGTRFTKQLHIASDNNALHYRNKMEYALYWDIEQTRIRLAFHARGSHRKIPIENSSIECPEILAKAKEIIADLNSRHEEARKYQSLLLRCNQNGEVSGGLFENHKPHPTFRNLTDKILGIEYSYSPNGFFQINLPVYEMALGEIKKHIHTEKVLDLYAGVGTIGLSIANDKDLTLVEINKDAYTELEKNASKYSSAKTILAKSEEALDFITNDETVIVDPPRAGCDKKLLDKILEVTPPTVIYLSCNPATQARDLSILSEKYQIKSITPFNFFPRTPHLENLVILEVK